MQQLQNRKQGPDEHASLAGLDRSNMCQHTPTFEVRLSWACRMDLYPRVCFTDTDTTTQHTCMLFCEPHTSTLNDLLQV
jgi:uncharacterized membrane protein